MNNALKTVGKTDDALRVANYMVLFGGRDLEGVASPRKNRDGSVGEFFTKSTAFDSSYTDMGFLYVDWEHGQSADDGLNGDDVLGFVDWKTVQVDEKGLFVERVLSRRNRYVQYLEELIGEELIGTSSEAVSSQVEKGEDGEIKSWPLRRDTLTVTPMEPRMLSENALAAFKALDINWEDKSTEDNTGSDPEVGSPEADLPSADSDEDENRKSEARRLSLALDIFELEIER